MANFIALQVNCESTDFIRLLVEGKAGIEKGWMLDSIIDDRDNSKCHITLHENAFKPELFEAFVAENEVAMSLNLSLEMEQYQDEHSYIIMPSKSNISSVISHYNLGSSMGWDELPENIFIQIKKWIYKVDQIKMQHNMISSDGLRIYCCNSDITDTTFFLNGIEYLVLKEGFYIDLYNIDDVREDEDIITNIIMNSDIYDYSELDANGFIRIKSVEKEKN